MKYYEKFHRKLNVRNTGFNWKRVKSVPRSPRHTYFFTTNPLVFYPGTMVAGKRGEENYETEI